MKTKVIDAFVIFSIGVVSVLLFILAAYFGAIEGCASRGYDTAVIGEHGIYCLNHEIKTIRGIYGTDW